MKSENKRKKPAVIGAIVAAAAELSVWSVL